MARRCFTEGPFRLGGWREIGRHQVTVQHEVEEPSRRRASGVRVNEVDWAAQLLPHAQQVLVGLESAGQPLGRQLLEPARAVAAGAHAPGPGRLPCCAPRCLPGTSPAEASEPVAGSVGEGALYGPRSLWSRIRSRRAIPSNSSRTDNPGVARAGRTRRRSSCKQRAISPPFCPRGRGRRDNNNFEANAMPAGRLEAVWTRAAGL